MHNPVCALLCSLALAAVPVYPASAFTQEPRVRVALIEGNHESGYYPDFVLYSDGTVLRWNVDRAELVTLALDASVADSLWHRLRSSLSFHALRSFYPVAEGWDFPVHRLFINDALLTKAVWVYGWEGNADHSVVPPEFSNRIMVIKDFEYVYRDKWRLAAVRRPPSEEVWDAAFTAIRDELEWPWVRKRLAWLLVSVLGIFVAVAMIPSTVCSLPVSTFADDTPAQPQWSNSLLLVGVLLCLAGLVGMNI